MPLNPFTGEFEGYDSPSTQAGMGMAAMSAAGMDAPLAFRMLEQSPGIATAVGFSAFRGSNTLMRGGSKPSLFNFNSATREFDRSKDFFGSGKIIGGRGAIGRRAARLTQDTTKTAFLRPALRTNFFRPRNFMQFTDLSSFADSSFNRYTPFGASSFIGNTKLGNSIASKFGVVDDAMNPNMSALGPGMLAGIGAVRRIQKLEEKALKTGNKRAIAKLEKVDNTIAKLAPVNNPGMLKGVVSSSAPMNAYEQGFLKYLNSNPSVTKMPAIAGSTSTSMMDDVTKKFVTGKGVGEVGARASALLSVLPGKLTQKVGGFFASAMGNIVDTASDNVLAGVRTSYEWLGKGLDGAGIVGKKSGISYIGTEGAEALFKNNTFRELGVRGVGQVVSQGGAKAAGALGARAVGLALPGVQVFAAASLVYDLGRMAGEVVKSGVKLARDAGKSLQGTIAKPTFGMGYKDTEAAATSRSRGVMAIQNSRLNMRSLLGSEAAMMAARYG